MRAQAGIVAAGVAVGVGHLVAALVNPVASPLLAVGSALIDAAPTPAKEFAVRTFGTNDKPILVSSIGVVLVVFGALAGARALNERVVETFGQVGPAILHISGARDYAALKSRVAILQRTSRCRARQHDGDDARRGGLGIGPAAVHGFEVDDVAQ